MALFLLIIYLLLCKYFSLYYKKYRQSLSLYRDTFNTYNNLLIIWILYIDLLDFAQNEYECAFEITDLKSRFIKVLYISLINIVLLYAFT